MTRFFRLTLWVFILNVGLSYVTATEIPVFDIAERVFVPGPQIYLADLGTMHNVPGPHSMDLMVDLGPAPYPGQVRCFSKDYLKLILKQKGFNQDLDIRMGERVEIRVESTCITNTQLEAAIQGLLPSNESAIIKKWIEFRNLPAETWLSKGEWQIKASALGDLPQVGTGLFRVALSKGNEVKTINVSGKIRALGRVYQAIRDLNRHSPINEKDFILVEKELTSGAEVLGPMARELWSTKVIKTGEVLEKNHLQPVPLVIKENIVEVMVKDGNITINMTGIAGKDGWLGDQIIVFNPTSKKKFQGRVTGPNLVEVNI